MRDLFSGDFDTINLARWRYESWNDPILWILSHSGSTQVEDMLQRCLKETQRPPQQERAGWCFSAALRWKKSTLLPSHSPEMNAFTGGDKKPKNVPGSLIEAKIRQCNRLDNSGSGSWLGHPSRCVPNGAICFETTAQSATGSYVWPGYIFLLSELWPTRQQDGWDAIRTFFCLQPLCVPSFLRLYSPFETSL